MKQNWKTYGFWILFTEAVGGASAWLTRDGMDFFETVVRKPPLTPPGWVFPIVWGLLFALMGIGAARIYREPATPARANALSAFYFQLFFNFFWSILFFNMRQYGLALLWLLLLWVLIIWMIRAFSSVVKWTGWLQLPYLLWVTFAAYLNYGVWRLNG